MTIDTDNPERDPALAAVWREHSAEMPPAELDAAVLAAAHRAVGSAPSGSAQHAAAGTQSLHATRPQRWWMPLAAAATIGAVALGILQTVPEEPHVTTHSASDMPAPAISPASPLREKLALDERKDASRAESQSTAQRAGSSEAPPPAAPTIRPAAPPASVPAKPAGKVTAQSNTDSLAATAPTPAATSPAAPQPFPAEQKRDADESGAANDRASRMLTAPSSAAPASEFQRRKENAVENAVETAAEERQALARSSPPAAAPVPERMAAASDDKRQRNEVAQSTPAASGAGMMAKKTASAEQDAAMRDSAARDSAMRQTAKPVDVDAWIVRIRKLHDDGKLADAAKELVAMRAAVPDADRRLPAELRAWAATVKP